MSPPNFKFSWLSDFELIVSVRNGQTDGQIEKCFMRLLIRESRIISVEPVIAESRRMQPNPYCIPDDETLSYSNAPGFSALITAAACFSLVPALLCSRRPKGVALQRATIQSYKQITYKLRRHSTSRSNGFACMVSDG